MGGGETSWHRLVVFLPVGNTAERTAAAAIASWMQEHCDGFTVSLTTDPVLAGLFSYADGEGKRQWDVDP